MGILLQHIKQEALTSYGINGDGSYIDNVRNNIINRHIGQSIFTKNTSFRNNALKHNPLSYRYRGYDTVPAIIGNNVGEAASIDQEKKIRETYLDSEQGLYGYSMNRNFLYKNVKYNSIEPTGALLNDSDVYDSYLTSTFPLPSLWNANSNITSYKLEDGSLVKKQNTQLFSIDADIENKAIFGRQMQDVILGANKEENQTLIKTINGLKYQFYQEGGITTLSSFSAASEDATVDMIGASTLENRSLINVTNRLFREKKIRSLINRFSSGENGFATDSGIANTAFSEHGHSRGRNLLRKEGKKEDYNGYSNPYCRVWTSHYQYAKLENTIRPFCDSENKDLYEKIPGFRPNEGGKRLNDNSVLMPNGLPRIAPTGSEDDLESLYKNVHKCMFSIENLAWKGCGEKYDNLSHSQKGQHDGRIMWFPPYGLSFNENVQANWEAKSFIGRGEPIYTYKDTTRTGNLSFILLIDHPSMIDAYSVTQGENAVKQENEDDLLRFFAGCDDLTDKVEDNKIYKEEEIIETEPDIEPKIEPLNAEYTFTVFLAFSNAFSAVDSVIDGITSMLDGGCNYELEPITGDNYKDPSTFACTTNTLCDSSILSSRELMKKKYGGNEEEAKIYLYDTRSYGLNTETFSNAVNSYIKNTNLSGETSISGITIEHIEDTIKMFRLGNDNLLISFMTLIDEIGSRENLIRYLKNMGSNDDWKNDKDEINPDDYTFEITAIGGASSHGYVEENKTLAKNRATSLFKYLKFMGVFNDDDVLTFGDCSEYLVKNEANVLDRSSFTAKIDRNACLTVKIKSKPGVIKVTNDPGTSTIKNTQSSSTTNNTTNVASVSSNVEYDYKLNAQNEYLYFRNLEKDDNLTYNKIVKKIQYFNPAFHSLTPEGFNARLTFLQQCTRQGPTTSASDSFNGQNRTYGAGNLSFGRQPYCILRIGDFFNSKVCIDSLQIEYGDNGIQWDLNPEGAGVQPMYAKITMGIKFVGGSDITGPIEKLQNAISSNFYANTSIYDKNADLAEQ